MTDPQASAMQRGDSLRASSAPPAALVIDNSAGLYPTDRWEATYFTVNRQGALTARRIAICVPTGFDRVCARILLGQAGGMLTTGQFAFPHRLLEAGFEYTYPDLESALEELLSENQS